MTYYHNLLLDVTAVIQLYIVTRIRAHDTPLGPRHQWSRHHTPFPTYRSSQLPTDLVHLIHFPPVDNLQQGRTPVTFVGAYVKFVVLTSACMGSSVGLCVFGGRGRGLCVFGRLRVDRHVTIGTPIVIFCCLTFSVFDDWYGLGLAKNVMVRTMLIQLDARFNTFSANRCNWISISCSETCWNIGYFVLFGHPILFWVFHCQNKSVYRHNFSCCSAVIAL